MIFTKENIISLIEMTSTFALDNLKQLDIQNIDFEKETDSFYYGIINRQFTLLNDLSILFQHKKTNFLGSQLVLFRCIVDDYLHIVYITNQIDSNQMLTNFNSDAYNKNFIKLEKLASLNETKLGGEYPFYPTYEYVDKEKEKFGKEIDKQNYFKDKENFKLKTFGNMASIIGKLDSEEYSHKLRRAYYFWGYLSDFVHYSNFSYSQELKLNPTKDHTFTTFAEFLEYSFQVIKISFEYFEKKFNLNIIDQNKLFERYKDAEH